MRIQIYLTAAVLFAGLVFSPLGYSEEEVKAEKREYEEITAELLKQHAALFEPLAKDEIDKSIKRGVDFLIQEQNQNGSFGSATNTKDLNIYAPIPGAHHGFRAATTSLCLMAMIKLEKSYPELTPSINKCEDWMIKELPRVRRAEADAIYNVWAHIYGIQALVAMHQRHKDESELRTKIEELINLEFTMLEKYESVDGGWGYYDFRYLTAKPSSDSISFVNAAGLVAFADARDVGINPPEKVKQRAIAATLRQRNSNFSYFYGEYLKNQPVRPINRAGGSLGRSQACNLALRLWGDEKVTNEVMGEWLNRLVLRNGWLDIGRKRPIPHESWFQVAGYFYYFGHYYAARSFKYFPENERPHYQQGIARLILSKQEKNGSWWDYPLYDYHPSYGTAFALLTLIECKVK